MLKALLGQLLPESQVKRIIGIQNALIKARLNRYPPFTEQQFIDLLTGPLGVKSGSVVLVHSSLNFLNLDFSAFRLFEMLQQVVGEEGTLLFPCAHIKGNRRDYLISGGVFNVKKSPAKTGLLPELARRSKNASRSLHPISSVVAVGKYAKQLTSQHQDSIYPCGELSPYYKIQEYDGVCIGLGVGTEKCSFLHCIEDVWQDRFPVHTRSAEVYDGKVIDEDGTELVVKTLIHNSKTHWMNVPRYIKNHFLPDIALDMQINGSRFCRVDASKTYAHMEELARQGITMYYRWVYER